MYCRTDKDKWTVTSCDRGSPKEDEPVIPRKKQNTESNTLFAKYGYINFVGPSTNAS